MQEKEKRFNIRVYGLLIDQENRILLSSENRNGFKFTKFPGGGLQWGEGPIHCLRREFEEECGIELKEMSHFYTTEFFQKSAFRENDQLISIYYKLDSHLASKIPNNMEALDVEEGNTHILHWEKITEINEEDLTFPVDRNVIRLLK